MITIIDYGAGNIGSVRNALDRIRQEYIVTSDPSRVSVSTKIILPGVGNFGDVMDSLGRLGLILPLKRFILSGRPFLGICVGYQALFQESEESPGMPGLGIFQGKVIRFRTAAKVPQVGWNNVNIKKCRLFSGIRDGGFFYFVHSFYPDVRDERLVMCETEYGERFASGISWKNIYATQFHPEKSGRPGLMLLDNFARMRE